MFLDLGFPPEEATLLAICADLMAKLRLTINENGWTQAGCQGARYRVVARVEPGMGKWERFSLAQRFASAHSAETEAD